ncbi:unnamed protein product, partial [Ectocarpus sp. 13 AM-2016]
PHHHLCGGTHNSSFHSPLAGPHHTVARPSDLLATPTSTATAASDMAPGHTYLTPRPSPRHIVAPQFELWAKHPTLPSRLDPSHYTQASHSVSPATLSSRPSLTLPFSIAPPCLHSIPGNTDPLPTPRVLRPIPATICT